MGWLECVRGNVAPSMALQCILKKLFVKLLSRWIGGCEAGHHELDIYLPLRLPVFPFKTSIQNRSYVSWGRGNYRGTRLSVSIIDLT